MSGRARTVHLTNSQGRGLTVTLREYRPGDEEGMLACIRDEYGDTYFKRSFYLPEFLKREAQSGRMTFLVAQTTPGEIAGMMLLKEFAPRENMCEIASQIFRKKYRRYGLAMPFFQYGMEIVLSRNYSAAYCLPVLFHDITQRLLYRLEMRAAGFVLNVFDVEQIVHSYQNKRNKKHSQGIQIRAIGKRDAGRIYVSEEHREFCSGIYRRLGAAVCMERQCGDPKHLPDTSILTYRQDERQASLEISVDLTGADLTEQVAALQERFPLRGKQTANLFLNISDANAVWAYKALCRLGYFFTGLKPLCSEREYMVLHHPGEVKIYFEDYFLSGEFAEMADYVGRLIPQKNNGKEEERNEGRTRERTQGRIQGRVQERTQGRV